MRRIKVSVTFLILAILLLTLSGCQESDKSKYEKAQSMLSKGQYSEAAAKFDELGSYEDSSKLSMKLFD